MYDESYEEDDCGYSYRSLRRQDRRPSPHRFGEQGCYSVRDWVDTPGFVQGGSSTRQEVRRLSPLRGPASSQALGATSRRDSPVRASQGSPARTQAPQASSPDRKERTTRLDEHVPW